MITVSIELAIAIGTVFCGFVVWLIRLEGKVFYTEKSMTETKTYTDKELADLKTSHTTLADKIFTQLGHIEKSLAKIEDRLSISEKE